MLARRGVNPFRIQSLGRWHSPLVVHYAGESLATGLAHEISRSAGGAAPNPPPELADIRDFLCRLESRLAAIEAAEKVGPGPDLPLPPPQYPADSYVLNRESRAYHRTPVASCAPAAEQQTVCGWKFGTPRSGLRATRSWYLRMVEIPPGTPFAQICSRCCSTERALAKATADSEVE